MLDLINRLFVRAQRRIQGIPRVSANLYEKLGTKYLEPTYNYVLENLMGKTIDTVLEIGCGTGKLLLKILDVMYPRAIVGLDISRAMIEIAKKNSRKIGKYPMVDLILADAHKIPIRPRSIDLIISTGTLHHIRDPETLFREVAEVLSRDGEALIYEFSHDISKEELKQSSKRLRRPSTLLKLTATLHGLPRKEYEEGYIKEALTKVGVVYDVYYEGITTLLKIKTSPETNNS